MSDKELKVIELEGTTYVPKILWDTAVEAIETLEKQVKELERYPTFQDRYINDLKNEIRKFEIDKAIRVMSKTSNG